LGTEHSASLKPNTTALYPFLVTNDHLRPLIDPITLQEVKQAVFVLPKDKASRPYGILIEFFQTDWEIVQDDIFHVVNAFYYNRLDLWRINQVYISLIPKKN
jgi:hypothetical protein